MFNRKMKVSHKEAFGIQLTVSVYNIESLHVKRKLNCDVRKANTRQFVAISSVDHILFVKN